MLVLAFHLSVVFLYQREYDEATGENWLFFGEQRFLSDFSYQVEWQNFLKKKVLTKMSLAFSRDTNKKIYVQDRMLENSKEVFEWLEKGAYVYVCGDMNNMAKGVNDSLLTIIRNNAKIDINGAKEYLNNMRKQKRYRRDVY